VLLNWDDKSAEALINTSSRSTSEVNLTGWSKSLEVTAGGEGIVSHAGLALLRQLTDKTGLAGGLSRALASSRVLIHDRGRVTADLACAIADGSEVISDFRVMADQKELFGLVASVPTAWRTLEEIAGGGPRALGPDHQGSERCPPPGVGGHRGTSRRAARGADRGQDPGGPDLHPARCHRHPGLLEQGTG
jgi:hypothetical protein